MTNPLSQADLRNLRRAIAAANEALLQIERAERAGLDMSEQRALQEAVVDSANKMLREYGGLTADQV